MSKSYKASNGQEITEDMIDRWCASYEKGEFPKGEHTAGSVVYGRPPLSEGEATVTLSVKVPAGLKEAIEQNAKAKGVSSQRLCSQCAYRISLGFSLRKPALLTNESNQIMSMRSCKTKATALILQYRGFQMCALSCA